MEAWLQSIATQAPGLVVLVILTIQFLRRLERIIELSHERNAEVLAELRENSRVLGRVDVTLNQLTEEEHGSRPPSP